MLSYAAVLRAPHARRTFGAALIGRLSYGTAPLSLLLAVKGASGSFGAAGTAMALFGATSVLLSPARAALIDRYGPRRALTPMACGYAALLLVLAAVTRHPGTPTPVIVALTATAGAGTPPLGPTMRTLWRQLLPERELLQSAYSLDGVAEELLFVTGPVLVGVLVAYASAAAGVAVSAVLVLTGTLALVSSPVAHVPPAPRADDAAPAVRVRAGLPGQPVVVALAVGLGLGGLELLVVAFAGHQDRPGAVAWVLAALSAGSAVGGLVNGAVTWRSPAGTRLPLIAAALGLSLAGAGWAPNLYVLGGAVALAGLFVAPALTTAYLIADETAAPNARTRAGAWVNTAVNAGSSGGTAAAGMLIGRLPLALCFALAAAPALLSAGPALWSRSRISRRPGPGGRPRGRRARAGAGARP
ncbi:MFS transporter [Streptomyces sp. NBC_01387]|uniref:MFS transporter n=1 Tax=Streptomyces sp. NBC_01387 TaxID=2903849 RepID=UPI00324F8E6C